jgi:putative PIN family toxin of toxin-antitoxin system
LKVVLDTNVIISSIFWKEGNSHRVVELAIDKQIRNHISNDIIEELHYVLHKKFEQPDYMINRQIDLTKKYSKIVVPHTRLKVVLEDPKDDIILECVLKSKADYIVTGDNPLLILKNSEKLK